MSFAVCGIADTAGCALGAVVEMLRKFFASIWEVLCMFRSRPPKPWPPRVPPKRVVRDLTIVPASRIEPVRVEKRQHLAVIPGGLHGTNATPRREDRTPVMRILRTVNIEETRRTTMRRVNGFRDAYSRFQGDDEEKPLPELPPKQAFPTRKPPEVHVMDETPKRVQWHEPEQYEVTQKRSIRVTEETTVTLPAKPESREYVKIVVTIPVEIYRLMQMETKQRKLIESPNPELLSIINEAILQRYVRSETHTTAVVGGS